MPSWRVGGPRAPLTWKHNLNLCLFWVFLFFVVSDYAVSDSCSATYQSWQEAEPVTS